MIEILNWIDQHGWTAGFIVVGICWIIAEIGDAFRRSDE